MNYRTQSKFARFLRNNAALLIIIFCVLAILTVVLVSYLTKTPSDPVDGPIAEQPVDKTPDDDKIPDEPTDPVVQPIVETFGAPVEFTSVGMEYTDGATVVFVFNSTLNQWATHRAIDLIAPDGTAVVAMKSGTVIEAGSTYALGYYVKIDHGDGVVATYASLSDVSLVAGDVVKKGDVIGAASTSASYEFSQGAHVHLEMTRDGKIIDPTSYVLPQE